MNLVWEGDVLHQLKLQRCAALQCWCCTVAANRVHALVRATSSSDTKQVIAETQDDWAELTLGKIPAKDYWIGSK